MARPQHFGNHTHWVPLYHYLTWAAMFTLIVGSLINVFSSVHQTALLSWMFVLLVFTTISVSFHCRSFALKAQDRAIRAEENLRYFILTGKRLDQKLSIHQVIALRFASDEEFIQLARRAADENLRPRTIKKLIVNWRPDNHRA